MNTKPLWFLTIFILLTTESSASFFKKKDFDLALGLQANSLLYKRGIITYKGYQVFPIYSVQLFNPNLLLAGSALYWNIPIKGKSFFIRTRLNFNSTPDEPLYETNEELDERVEREKTNELDIYLEKYTPNGSFFRAQISKDLKAHRGSYYELFSRVSLINLDQKSEPSLLNLGFFVSVGYGDDEHNTYLYGTGGKGGSSFNNIEYGLSLTSPKVIDSFWPTLKISTFEILGDNKERSFVRETTGTSIEALFAFRI